ncbi:MAG: hypothetical protein LBL91_06220 [Lachnospiraceae bacterium]|jgi:hypothetical protein|nr:hypothetical protein [Lachnospiraceae bacterium]
MVKKGIEGQTYSAECGNCKWHENFSGACGNGNSEHVADFTDNDMQACEY